MTQIIFSALQCEVLEDQVGQLREKIKTELSDAHEFILRHSDGGKVIIQKRNSSETESTR